MLVYWDKSTFPFDLGSPDETFDIFGIRRKEDQWVDAGELVIEEFYNP